MTLLSSSLLILFAVIGSVVASDLRGADKDETRDLSGAYCRNTADPAGQDSGCSYEMPVCTAYGGIKLCNDCWGAECHYCFNDQYQLHPPFFFLPDSGCTNVPM